MREGGRRGGDGAPPSAAQPKCGVQTEGLHICGISVKAWLACVSLFFFTLFCFWRLLYSESVGGRARIRGGRSEASPVTPHPAPHAGKAPQPGCSAGGEEEDAGNKLRNLLAQGNGCFTTPLLYPGHRHDKYKLSEDQNTRENNSHP